MGPKCGFHGKKTCQMCQMRIFDRLDFRDPEVQPTPAMAPQMAPHRYRGRRTYRTTRNRRCSSRFQLQSTKMLQTAPFYLRTSDFKDFRQIMMATGPRAARGRTNAGESVGCIGLAATGLLPRACSHLQAIRIAKCSPLGPLRIRWDD
jgi:hypothetical protein